MGWWEVEMKNRKAHDDRRINWNVKTWLCSTYENDDHEHDSKQIYIL